MLVISSVITAGLIYGLNSILLKLFGVRVVTSFGPVGEELIKTFVAVVFAVDIVLSHVAFGVIEGLWDFNRNSKHGWQACILSIVAHAVFGLITIAAYQKTTYVLVGVFAATLAHWLWNVYFV